MTCPTLTNLRAILAAYDAPQGPSKADTIKAIALLLGGWINVKTRRPTHGQRIQGASASGAWVETWDADEPIGHMTHWRAVADDFNDATECEPPCATLEQQFAAEAATGLVYLGEFQAMGQSAPDQRANNASIATWHDRSIGATVRTKEKLFPFLEGEIADLRAALAIQSQPVAAQGGITISATAMQEIRALIANLAAVVRVQNGNLHEDTNSLLTHADKAIAILAAKGGSV